MPILTTQLKSQKATNAAVLVWAWAVLSPRNVWPQVLTTYFKTAAKARSNRCWCKWWKAASFIKSSASVATWMLKPKCSILSKETSSHPTSAAMEWGFFSWMKTYNSFLFAKVLETRWNSVSELRTWLRLWCHKLPWTSSKSKGTRYRAKLRATKGIASPGLKTTFRRKPSEGAAWPTSLKWAS